MRKLLPAAVRVIGPQLPFALGVFVLLALVAGPEHPGPQVWVSAVVVGLTIALIPVIERASGGPWLRADGLPGITEPRRPPGRPWIKLGAGLLVLASAISATTGPGWLLLAIALLGAVTLFGVAALAARRLRHHGRYRGKVKEAIEQFGPAFALYTGRRNDASYQLGMWIPLLERMQLPYLVVVRHSEAIPTTRQLTDAPIICCPATIDLDCLAVDSLRAAFYVNMIAQNTSFVLYRQLRHIYLGHGDSDKELSAHPGHAMFDRIFVAGQAAIDRYRAAGVLISGEKFIVVGRPQLAGIRRAMREINEIAVPRVLLAPTWRGYNSKTTLSSLTAVAPMARALIDRGAEVIFRPHPFSWLGPDERATIAATDSVLAADRSASGRGHLLATEARPMSVREVFDASDACITDIGSVLVDYFATGKPYAAVLPGGVQPDAARELYPTTRAAYLIDLAEAARAGSAVLAKTLDELLGTDPLAAQRPGTARYYLGDHPGDDAPFLRAARAAIDRNRPEGIRNVLR